MLCRAGNITVPAPAAIQNDPAGSTAGSEAAALAQARADLAEVREENDRLLDLLTKVRGVRKNMRASDLYSRSLWCRPAVHPERLIMQSRVSPLLLLLIAMHCQIDQVTSNSKDCGTVFL